MPPRRRPPATRATGWAAPRLGEAGEEAIAALLTLRPDLYASGPATLGELAQAVVDPSSLAMLHRRCSRPFRQLLEALCLASPPVSLGSVAGLLGVEPAELAPFVDRLEAAFVVRRQPGGQLVVNPGLAAALPHPARLGPPLRQVLAVQPADVLRTIATRVGLAAPTAKEPTLDLLVEHLSDRAFVAKLLAGGPDGTAGLAALVAERGPEVRLNVDPDVLLRNDASPGGYLMRRGLLTPTGWRRAIMAKETALAVRGGRAFADVALVSPPLDLEPSAADPDPSAAEAAQQLVADVATLAELWAATPARLLQAGGLGVREVRRLAKALGRSEPDAARLVDLAQLAELIAEGADGSVLPTRRYDRWRAKDGARRWADLAATWLAAPIYLSLAGSPGDDGKPIPALYDRDVDLAPIAQRAALLAALAGLPAGMRSTRPSLLERLRFDQPALWSDGPAEPATLVSWFLDEAARLGLTADDRCSSFGRALLLDGNDDDDEDGDSLEAAAVALAAHLPPQVDHLILQADLTALAPGELAPVLRAELELLADLESSGSASLWRFTPGSLERAFDAGRTADDVLAFLTTHAPKGVPQPLAYLVADLGRRYGRVRVAAATSIVRSDDPALLAELVGARRLSGLKLRLLAPTVAATSVVAAAAVTALRAAGYLAAPEDAAGQLAVSRPAARRAGLSRPLDLDDDEDDDLDDEDDDEDGLSEGDLHEMLEELLRKDPRIAAAMTGLPEDLLRSIGRRPGGALAALTGPVEDPAAMARRLRSGGSSQAAASGSAASPTAGSGPPPGQLRLLNDRDGRPSAIARTPDDIATLLELACEEEWLVRLSCSNGRGETRELDAVVLDLDERTITVGRLPRGDLQEVARQRIHWARILTEAEEEARL